MRCRSAIMSPIVFQRHGVVAPAGRSAAVVRSPRFRGIRCLNAVPIVAAVLLVAMLALISFAAASAANLAVASPRVDLLTVDGAIDPIEAQYVTRGLAQATHDGASVVLLDLNTPGGLDSAMRQITGQMLTSPVPVVVYVTPDGARAGSAGVFLMMAADVGAMAPGTNVGAAHPVGTSGDLQGDERTKVTNDAAAYIRMLATTRQHNANWAESAVRQSVALTAEEAKQQDVVNLIASNRADLLSQLQGRSVSRGGKTLTLQTRDAVISPIEMTPAEQLLHAIDDPNVAYLLLSIGGWALLAELFHPGSLVPGVVGVLCLALGLTALQSLPMNWTGLVLIVVALGLFVVDVKAASHGVLTGAGLVTFIVGSLMLFSPVPMVTPDTFAVEVSPLLVTGIGAVLAAFFGFVVRSTMRARHQPAMAIGAPTAGVLGIATTTLSPTGTVRIKGESWNAITTGETIEAGNPVLVVARKGLQLIVRGSPKGG
ncbi:MAG TPA: nodulation protein NfeD [Chloroflexota bacterium]|nr:nodulation protein NfeD [Chloroflexota bacterium]